MRLLLLHFIKSFITHLRQVLHILSTKNILILTPNSANFLFVRSISAFLLLLIMSVVLLHQLLTANQVVLWASTLILILVLTSILVFYI